MTQTVWVTRVTFWWVKQYHCCETSLLHTSSCFEAFGICYILSRSLCVKPVLYSAKNKVIPWHCFTSKLFMSFLLPVLKVLKMNFQHVGHRGSYVGYMGITSRLPCGSVDKEDKQVWSTFNPELQYAYIKVLFFQIMI